MCAQKTNTSLFFVVVREMRKRNPLDEERRSAEENATKKSHAADDEERSAEENATKKSHAKQQREENKVVVIVGGGIAGCAVACELARRGYEKNVLLLEKDESKSSRRQGYGLTISETNTAIEKMKVLNALKRENVSSKQHWTIDARNGDVLGYFGQLFREYLFVSSKSPETALNSVFTAGRARG